MAELLATSDLHVGHPENRALVEEVGPRSADDWLIVAGDVGERIADIEWALRTLAGRFAKVFWVPGNHELWTPPGEEDGPRGVERYRHLVDMCRSLGIVTPEDPYEVWEGPGGPVTIAPMFLLYDYTFRPEGATTKEEGLAIAYERGIVCTDERFLHPDPYPSREAWCEARLAETRKRLEDRPAGVQTVLVNHWPLTRDPTRVLWYPEFAQWCGTVHTDDWHVRYDAKVVVYGHLHIPRTIERDGVPFVEVSLGYPREWKPRGTPPVLRPVFPD
ncbi:metallophosphoesterase family protein [Thermomonospora amylolytica]|uniref:metallophosphoesterase family protein n=1 Tax=Thermomonospora amylolytica TaxID=1411117 RepID=UPI000E6CA96F|nr:metallophosphoesterase [Thermomonospora amylolytica]